jgi:CRISPR-associated endonuclease/helicase Cas3
VKQLLEYACKTHDYGKINPSFQNRIKKHYKFNPKEEVGHNILSYFLLDFLELDNEISKEDIPIVANAVLNHHHYVDNHKIIIEKSDLIIKQLGQILNLLGDSFLKYDVEKSVKLNKVTLLNEVNEVSTQIKAQLIKGLLHKCDYAASANIPIEIKNDFLESFLNEFMQNKKAKKPNSEWNELQIFCMHHQDENLLITAPTGMGKTEAALWWIGDNKGFFILPLRTAINAMYDRIKKEVLQDTLINDRLALLHGETMSVYGKEQDETEEYNLLDYYEKSRQFSIPVTVSTPDQLFDFVFKYPGFELKLATMSYSKVVIDEIQAYGPDLLAYIIYGLQQIHDFGGKFAIITATFPPFIKDLLVEKGANDSQNNYINIVDKKFSTDLKRHNLKIFDEELSVRDIVIKHNANIKLGKSSKCLVVCNTIKKAQEVYTELLKEEIDNVILFHAKFIKYHRSGKEKMILETGKTYKDDGVSLNNLNEIWVTTQIVEASLDIDFDYLFTELSDLNGLFQRLGRCNRKGAKPINESNCYVYTKINKNILIRKNRDMGFIDEGIYSLSKEAIENFGDGIITEDDKQNLIETYMTTEKLNKQDSRYLSDYWGHYNFVSDLYFNEMDHRAVSIRFRNIISYNVIPEPIYENQEIRLEIDRILGRLEKISETFQEASKKKERISDKHKESLQLERIRLKDNLRSYTVPVGYYDVYYGKNGDRIIHTIKLGNKEEILVIKAKYDETLGFQRVKSKELDSEEKSETTEVPFDSFG